MSSVLAVLRKELQQAEKTSSSLRAAIKALGGNVKRRRAKRRVARKEHARRSKAQRARWAKIRAEQSKPKT